MFFLKKKPTCSERFSPNSLFVFFLLGEKKEREHGARREKKKTLKTQKIMTIVRLRAAIALFLFVSACLSCLTPCEEPKCCDTMTCDNRHVNASCIYDGNIFYCSCGKSDDDSSRYSTENYILLLIFFCFFGCLGLALYIIRLRSAATRHPTIQASGSETDEGKHLLSQGK